MAAHSNIGFGRVESLPGPTVSPGPSSVFPVTRFNGEDKGSSCSKAVHDEFPVLTTTKPSTLPPTTNELVRPSICIRANPKYVTDKEALRLLSTHPGLAQQYQDLTTERLKEYMAVVDASYKERLGQLEKDFESFKTVVSKLGQVGQDRPIGTNAHESTLLQWKGPLHNGGGFTPQLPKVSPAWYRPATDNKSGHTQPGGGLSVPPPPNTVTQVRMPNSSPTHTSVLTGLSSLTELLSLELVYLKVDGPLAGTFRLALSGLPWEHPGISFVLQALPSTRAPKYTGLLCTAAVTPRLTDFVIERTPENLMLLLEAHHRLRDRKLQLTTCWRRRSGLPAPKKAYVYEDPTTPASKLWHERTRFKPFANLTVKVPLPDVTDAQVAFSALFRTETRRLLFSRGVVGGNKKTKPVSYIDVLSGRDVEKQKDDIVLPETKHFLSTLSHFAKSLLATELAAMELAKSNHRTVANDNLLSAGPSQGNNANAPRSQQNNSSFLQRGIQSIVLGPLRSIPSWPGIKPLIGFKAGKDDKQPAATDNQVKPTESRQAVKPATSLSSKNTRTNKRAAVDDPADHDRPPKSLKVSVRHKIAVKPTIKMEDLESDRTIAVPHKPTRLTTGLSRSNALPGHSLRPKQSPAQGEHNGHHGYYTSQATQNSWIQQRRRPYRDYDRPPSYEQYKYDRAESLLVHGNPPQPFRVSGHGRLDRRASF
ncbi:hypothetical protein DL546_006134 [Coniochaeta pulveracea]|uniref:Uncharacterized protein n=1 Tax=Coniochaeta pulveracea TaxID=177199 RepID=A0A420YBL9_9PEZI|nr:hypothetical protein DL546_006134 [Coniochaeta pulveracea]